MKTINVTSRLMEDVLTRAIKGEITDLVQTMNQCDRNDFMQYQIAQRCEEQLAELRDVMDQLEQTSLVYDQRSSKLVEVNESLETIAHTLDTFGHDAGLVEQMKLLVAERDLLVSQLKEAN